MPDIKTHLRIRLLVLLLTLQFGAASSAVEVDYLYTVNVPVVSQSSTERAEAFRLAMQTLLIRISGNREMATHPDAGDITSKASRYVRQYIYTSLEKTQPPSITATSEKNAQPQPTQVLKIEFDGRAIEKRLNEKNLPVWGQNRPATLVWLAVQEAKRSTMVGASDLHPLKALVESAAMQRGIPLIFPLQDLEDQQNLRVADIRLGFADTVQKASTRYGAEMILVGMLTQRGQDQWSALCSTRFSWL